MSRPAEKRAIFFIGVSFFLMQRKTYRYARCSNDLFGGIMFVTIVSHAWFSTPYFSCKSANSRAKMQAGGLAKAN
jgi:hypothetical protein